LLGGETTTNVVVSPVVVQFLLTMLAMGATHGSSTHQEIRTLLGMGPRVEDETQYLVCMQALKDSLKEVDLARVANGIFADIQMNADFVGKCKDFLEADVANTMTKKAVNDWVAEKTNGKIKDFLTRNPQRFMLVSALYAGGPAFEFTVPFDAEYTSTEEFHTSEETVMVRMMAKTEHLPYVTGACFTGVDLEYGNDGRFGGRFKARVALPNEGVSIDEVMREIFDRGLRVHVTYTKVNLRLPRFELECTVDLKSALENLMPTAFSSSADFGRMTAKTVQISEAIQKASLKVTEVGTEAAAAGCAGATRSISRPKQVICDREFLFFILDEMNDMVLFAARVNNPTAVQDDKAPAAEEEMASGTYPEQVIIIEDVDSASAAEEHQVSGTSKEQAICIDD
jgi:serpin B